MKKYTFILITIILLIVSCMTKDIWEELSGTESNNNNPKEYKVYVSGFYNNGSREVACYWKNGIKTDLSGSSESNDIANSIYVSSGDVYASGYYFNGSLWIACYWIV